MSLKHSLLFLAIYLKPHRFQLGVLAFLLVCSIGLQLGNPYVLGSFIDAATRGAGLGVFIVFGLCNQGLVVLTAYVSGRLAWATTNELRLDLVRHCLQLDMAFHTAYTPGALMERTDEDVSKLTNLFSLFVLQVVVNLLLLVGVLGVFVLMDWRLGAFMLVYTVVSLAVFRYTNPLLVPRWVAASQAKAELHGFVGEHVAGMVDIRTSGAVPYIMQRFYVLRRTAFLRQWFAQRDGTLLSGGTDVLLILGSVGAFLVAVALFQMGVLSLGKVYMVVTYTQLITQPLQDILSQLDDLRQARASLERIQQLYGISGEVQQEAKGELPAGPLGVRFCDVSFAYNDEIPVLKNITLSIEAGEVCALIGRTGSGKTTLARLLMRLYDPTEGSIQIGGQDIGCVAVAAVRQRVGMVTQDVQLFYATVRDNVTFFDCTIADERIVQVMHEVGLAGWLHALPKGLDTLIDNAEAGLSAGEAQLLALVRIFLRNPDIIILDEASARLDPATEQLIERALDRLLVGRTVLIIAHRLSTIKRAHKVVSLEQGRIGMVQDGAEVQA